VVEVELTVQILVVTLDLEEVELVEMDRELQLEQPILVVEVDLVVILVVLDKQVVQVS
tara:strand:- start:10 stop:183 length:174 start_codon:yes stop_codon:yes gene_type:complete